MKNLNELCTIEPEIAAHIEATYPDGAAILDVPSPHALAHQIAERWPGLGAAFYMLVADAARECLLGADVEQAAPALPHFSHALAGLINSKDSSWF